MPPSLISSLPRVHLMRSSCSGDGHIACTSRMPAATRRIAQRSPQGGIVETKVPPLTERAALRIVFISA